MNITYEIDGMKYHKQGYYGCQLYSIEGSKKLGDTRVIFGRLLYVAFMEKRTFRKPIVKWCLLDNSMDSIETFFKILRRD